MIVLLGAPLLAGAAATQAPTMQAQSSASSTFGASDSNDDDGSRALVTYRSMNGILDITLTAETGRIRIGDLDLDGATYNNHYAGPVLRVRPGDLLRVHLVNRLMQPTNLHFHGIRASPQGNSDNAHLSVAPGARFTYDLRIPTTQPPGLYWYHAHLHGESEWQVMHGLSGALVVEGSDTGLRERLFVLKDITFDDDTGNAKIDDDFHGIVQSVNGALESNGRITAGETQLWRFTNQSANRAVHIALEGHRFRIVQRDGEAILDPQSVDVLDIMPAARVEVLVEGGQPGRYALIARGLMTGAHAQRRSDRMLGQLEVLPNTAPALAVVSPVPQPTSPKTSLLAAAPPDLRAVQPDARRTISFSQTNTLDPSKQKFFVNGLTYDSERVDVRVPLGAVEEWTIRNDTDDMHVFHIHQIGFQIVGINGAAAAFEGYVDTVKVPERGSVTLRLAFADPVILGSFMFHCHVLKHEDKGMMAQIEVYDPRRPRLVVWFQRFTIHVWWWLNGIPWALCGA